MELPYNTRYLLIQRELPLVAEISASSPDRRAWVYVEYNRGAERSFIATHVEVLNSWLEPPGDDLTQDHAEVFDEFATEKEEQFVALLQRWLSDPGQLTQLWEPSYPL